MNFSSLGVGAELERINGLKRRAPEHYSDTVSHCSIKSLEICEPSFRKCLGVCYVQKRLHAQGMFAIQKSMSPSLLLLDVATSPLPCQHVATLTIA
jgi:hypothetical protein